MPVMSRAREAGGVEPVTGDWGLGSSAGGGCLGYLRVASVVGGFVGVGGSAYSASVLE